MTEQINHIPVVPLRGLTVFPGMAVHFDVIRMKSIEGIQQAMLAGPSDCILIKTRWRLSRIVPLLEIQEPGAYGPSWKM